MNLSALNSPESKKPLPKKLRTAKPLPRSFYLRDTLAISKDLLGKGLLVESEEETFLCEIVEVEAYLGGADPASHAFRGVTKRNWPMFEEGGRCYVYLSYGLNYCMNVVTQKKGLGEAVLLRAAVPLYGLDTMRKNRGLDLPLSEKEILRLTNGPGKLCQALGIDLSFNGRDFTEEGLKIIDLGRKVTSSQIGSSPRIGITKAAELCYRYFIKSSPWLSRREVKSVH
jgi:DNA-3-methyladenine glycosylase